jgi:hypothetical protein
MRESIATLLTSKRALVALFAAGIDCLILLGLPIEPALAEQLAVLVTTIAGVLIGGISVSDAGKAMSMPAGVGHKPSPVALPSLVATEPGE